MCLIAHLIAGFALGSALKVSLWILVPAALGLHVLLDLVPHWDYGFSLAATVVGLWRLRPVGGDLHRLLQLPGLYGARAPDRPGLGRPRT